MGVRHAELPIHGVQFHPESILTEGGHRMLANWLAYCGEAPDEALVRQLGGRGRRHRARAATDAKFSVIVRVEVDRAARPTGSESPPRWCC